MTKIEHIQALKDANNKRFQAQIRLKSDRCIYRKRKAVEYRNNDIEWRRIQERNWHRRKTGKPLDDPVRKQKSHQKSPKT